MSIQDLLLKFKGFVSNTEYLLALLIVVVSLSSFMLGRLSVAPKSLEKQPEIRVVEGAAVEYATSDTGIRTVPADSSEVANTTAPEGGYVASKNGTKYHLPWCGSAKQIKDENKIWFKTKEEAERAGYEPASNCKGI